MHQKQLCTNNYNLKNCHCFVNKERISKKFVKHSIMTISGTSSIYEFSFCFISFTLTMAFSTVNYHVFYRNGLTSEKIVDFYFWSYFTIWLNWSILVRFRPKMIDSSMILVGDSSMILTRMRSKMSNFRLDFGQKW